jgi:putative FmdB family regulatory protein
MRPMPTYEFRCRACGATFEERRSMADVDAPAACPDGHLDTTRLLSVFSATGTATPGPAAGGGGCCGGACGCS